MCARLAGASFARTNNCVRQRKRRATPLVEASPYPRYPSFGITTKLGKALQIRLKNTTADRHRTFRLSPMPLSAAISFESGIAQTQHLEFDQERGDRSRTHALSEKACAA